MHILSIVKISNFKLKLKALLILSFAFFIFTHNIKAQESEFEVPTDSEAVYTKHSDLPPNGIIVKYKNNQTIEVKTKLLKKFSLEASTQALSLDNMDKITISEKELTIMMEKLEKEPEVEYVEPNYYLDLYYIPNDKDFKRQYYLNTIKAPVAWDTTKGNPNVIIGIVDTGIKSSHPDIAAKIIKKTGTEGTHGTHVGCIAGAITNNGIGIAGISAGNVVSAGADAGGGMLDMARAINGIKFATDNGAKVINMSWGGPQSSKSLQSAINYAWGKDVVLVAAAGNESSKKLGYPASYSNVVSVAATDSKDNLAHFSNRGAGVTIAAPGVAIYSCVPNGYKAFDGTSMASPVVTGVVALIRSAFPTLKNQQVVDKLCSTADKIQGTGTLFKCGRVNAANAVKGGVGGSGNGSGNTPNPTGSGTGTGNLTIKLRFQGINTKSKDQNLKITLSKSFSNVVNGTFKATSDDKGIYTVKVTGGTITSGIYNLSVKGTSHLQKRYSNVTITQNGQTIDLTQLEKDQLKSGDVNGDNKITIEDVSQILKYYTNFSVPVAASDTKSESSDITKDGNITIQDVALISINWSNFLVPGDN